MDSSKKQAGKRKMNKRGIKVVYISTPMKVKTSASKFRALVQELTGKDSDIFSRSYMDSNHGGLQTTHDRTVDVDRVHDHDHGHHDRRTRSNLLMMMKKKGECGDGDYDDDDDDDRMMTSASWSGSVLADSCEDMVLPYLEGGFMEMLSSKDYLFQESIISLNNVYN